MPCPEVKTGHVEIAGEDYLKIQKAVDAGQNQWRLSPVRTAQVVGSRNLGLSPNDAYTLVERFVDPGSGLQHAVVNVKHQRCTFTATLYQPVTQGQHGIWVVETVDEK